MQDAVLVIVVDLVFSGAHSFTVEVQYYRNDHYFSRSTSFRQLHSQDATNTRFVAPCISIDHGGDGKEL